MIENSTAGLTMLDPDHEVVATREEHHQATLAAYAPRPDGRARRVAAELCFATIAQGRYAGQRGIEVRIDGRRVGELTFLMSQRYGPIVEDVLRRGGRPACIALVKLGRRGVEVELRLPEPGAVPVPPVPSPMPPPPPRGPGPDGGPRPPAPPRSGSGRRAPLLVGAGVLAVLVVIGISVNAGNGDRAVPSTSSAAAASTSATTTTQARATTTAAAPTTTAATTTTTTTRATTTTRTVAPVVVEPPAPDPEPERVAPPVQAAAAPEPEPEQQSGCHPSYSGCLPIVADLNCPQVDGPVTVKGADVYGLDRDNDGVGCES